MTTVPHPAWCSASRCTASGDGPHESEPTTIRVHQRGAPPRLLLMLWAPRTGHPVRLRMVAIGDHLINTIDLDLDSGHLAAVTILRLLDEARPPEHTGPVPTEDQPNG